MSSFTNIKLLVSDLDGTLLHDDKSLDSQIIEQLQQKNVLFTLASGRNYFVTKDFVKKLNIKIPYIVNNGANIYLENECIYTCEIDENDLKIYLECFEKYQIPFLAHSINEAYFYLNDTRIDTLKNRLIGKCPIVEVKECNELLDKKILKIVMFDSDMEVLSKQISDETKNTKCMRTENNMYTVNNVNVDKGEALVYLLKYLQIPSSDVLVFGDNFNDEPMFDVCAGVAVENAQDSLKLKAKYLTESNENDGVSAFIDKYL